MKRNTRWLLLVLATVAATSAVGTHAPAAAESRRAHVVVGTDSALARAEPNAATARLNLQGELRLRSGLVACQGPDESGSTCASRTGEGLVSGLGRVSVRYTWRIDLGPPSCTDDRAKTLTYGVVLVVAGKGEIRTALSEGDCVDIEAVRNQPQSFAIIGGTGVYAGASGAGTVSRSLGQTASGAAGSETWIGTLDVPGVTFDVTPPSVSAPSRKTFLVAARSRSARVSYRIDARDDVDGNASVSCTPRSGTRFPVGRTTVTCLATDASGNVGTTRFVIMVKRRRA